MFDLSALPFEYLIVAGVVGLALAVAMMANLKWAMVVVAGMFLVASMGVQGDEFVGVRLWLYPIQANRSPLFLGMGVLLFAGVIGHISATTSRGLPAQGLLILAIGLYAGLLRIVHESPASGLMSIVFVLATTLPLLFVVLGTLEEWDDFYFVLRWLLISNIAWIALVGVQFVLNPSLLTLCRNSRFFGLTGNPQHAAAYLGVAATISLWLYLNDPQRRLRLVWLALLGLNGILLVWTGSRTGVGMFVVGAVLATYGRLGRTALYLPLAVGMLLVMYSIMQAANVDMESVSHLASTVDTRSGAWANMIDSGMRNPILGAGIEDAGDSENSYFYAFAAYGAGMIGLILLLMATSAIVGIKLFFQRWSLHPDHRTIIDLTIGFNAMFFAGAVFEGYLMARVAGPLLLMIVFSAIALRLTAKAREEALAAGDAAYDGFEEYADEAEGYGDYGGYDDGFEEYEDDASAPAASA